MRTSQLETQRKNKDEAQDAAVVIVSQSVERKKRSKMQGLDPGERMPGPDGRCAGGAGGMVRYGTVS